MPNPCPTLSNLADHALAAGRATPDKIALAVLGPARAERWSYARLEAAVRGTATGLLAQGLRPGDRVLLRIGNTPEFPIAFLGAIAAGLVPVPTAESLTQGELDRLTPPIAAKAVLAAPGVALPSCGTPVLNDLHALAAHPPTGFHPSDPDDIAYIVFTSGSSGQPKAVAHAHRALGARRMMWQGWYGLTAQDRVLHAGAFNWTFTLGTGLLDPWTIGATALIAAQGTPPEALPLLLRRHDATLFAAAPGVFRKLLRQDGATLNLPKLRHALSAGEKLPEAVRAAWQARTGTRIHEALGMSECSTFISGSPARPAPQGSLGYAQPGRRIAILDPDGAPVSDGATGTLAIHRSDPGLMIGYLEPERAPVLPLTGDWFVTGDLVCALPDGALVYHGRRDDLLTTGGFRISPIEIEAAFHDAPGITDCAATAVTVKTDTQVLALAYTGTAQPDAALRDHASTRLADYKRPRLYLHLQDLPRSPNGKLDRNALVRTVKDAP